MKKIKTNIYACTVFIIISILAIIFMDMPYFKGLRTYIVSLPVLSILKGKGEIISNISIGILGSSIIAQVSHFIEYLHEKKAFIGKINNSYWRLYEYVLPELYNYEKEDILRLFDLGGIFNEFSIICNEYTKINVFGKLNKEILNKIVLVNVADRLCVDLLNIVRLKDLMALEKDNIKEMESFLENIINPIDRISGLKFIKDYEWVINQYEEEKYELDINMKNFNEKYDELIKVEKSIRAQIKHLKMTAREVVGEVDINRPNLLRAFE